MTDRIIYFLIVLGSFSLILTPALSIGLGLWVNAPMDLILLDGLQLTSVLTVALAAIVGLRREATKPKNQDTPQYDA